jgi:hypothetical protein
VNNSDSSVSPVRTHEPDLKTVLEDAPPGYEIRPARACSPSEVDYDAFLLYFNGELVKTFEAGQRHVPNHPLLEENPDGGEVYHTVYPARAEVVAFAWRHHHSLTAPGLAS